MKENGNLSEEDFSPFKNLGLIVRSWRLVEILLYKGSDLISQGDRRNGILVKYVAYSFHLKRLIIHVASPDGIISNTHDDNKNVLIFSENSILRLITDKLLEIATRYKEFRNECLNLIRWFDNIFIELEYIGVLRHCIDDVKNYLEML
uniref:Uncharacterized protein n=1 Tax=Meloidogyne incognita TaxID=6306 RepID=A0A914LKA1_MELIC